MAIRAELCKRSLKSFLLDFWEVIEPSTKFVDNWSIDCFTEHLQHIDEIKRLVVNVCPGSTKSSIFNVLFPTWKWANDPTRRYLCAGYDLVPAVRDARRMRDLIDSEKFQSYYPGLIRIVEDQNEKRNYENDKLGCRQTTSINGGAVTGLKANYLILDDPHHASDAQSPLKRQATINWFCDVFENRLSDMGSGSIIVVGQRIHNNDLSGFIQENYSDYTILNLPYEYKPTSFVSPIGWSDPRTEPGEPLWEARFPTSVIKNQKRRPATFAAQWNQNPTESTDNPIKPEHFRYYSAIAGGYQLGDKFVTKDETFRVTCVDPAMTESQTADYTVMATVDISADGNIIVADILRERMAGTKLLPKLHQVYNKQQPSYILIESYGFAKLIYEQARLEGLPVRPVTTWRVSSDMENIKFIRSLDLQDALQSSKLWFPREATWLAVTEQELTDFPQGKHDDICDALGYLCKEARLRTRFTQEQQAEQREEADKTPEEAEAERTRRYWEMVWAD